MLDTNTVSYLISGRSASARKRYLQEESRAEMVVSTITEAEILLGLAKKALAVRLRAESDLFFAVIRRLAWDSKAASAYSQLGILMNDAGLSLSPLDRLIAAHAHAVGATLVTHDRAFHRLSSFLAVEDWATD